MYKMDYEPHSFECILDKGSFDALCVDEEPETKANVTKYCDGIKRVLRNTIQPEGGFLNVSLLQDFVLDQLLSNFTGPDDKFEINIHIMHQPTMEGASHFQRYFTQIRYADKSSINLAVSHDGEQEKDLSAEEVKKKIKEI